MLMDQIHWRSGEIMLFTLIVRQSSTTEGIGAIFVNATQIEYNRTPYQYYDRSNCGQLCLQFLQTVDDQFKN